MNSVIELTHKQIDLCTGESLLTCPFDHVMIQRPSYTCASAILFQQDYNFNELCDSKVYADVQVQNSIFPYPKRLFGHN